MYYCLFVLIGQQYSNKTYNKLNQGSEPVQGTKTKTGNEQNWQEQNQNQKRNQIL